METEVWHGLNLKFSNGLKTKYIKVGMLNLFTSSTQKMNKAILQDLENYESGWLLTLNAITTDFIKHENLVKLLTNWINKYCYGRAFRKAEKRLRIVSACEIGTVN